MISGKITDNRFTRYTSFTGQNFIFSSQNAILAIYLQEGNRVAVTYYAKEELFILVKVIVIVGIATP